MTLAVHTETSFVPFWLTTHPQKIVWPGVKTWTAPLRPEKGRRNLPFTLQKAATVSAESALHLSIDAAVIMTVFDTNERPIRKILYDADDRVIRQVGFATTRGWFTTDSSPGLRRARAYISELPCVLRFCMLQRSDARPPDHSGRID